MSGTTLTIGGGYNGQSGILPVPTNFASSIYNTLQSYLNSAAATIGAGGLNLINDDLGTDTVTQNNGSTSTFQTVTNYDSGVGGSYVTNPGASGSVTVSSTAVALAVEDPATLTVTGSASIGLAIFGASSNVTYNNVSAQGSVYAAGGSNTLNLNGQVSVYSAGTDSINLSGPNTVRDQVSVLAGANDTITLSESVLATVSASGSAAVEFTQNAGGILDFVNGSQSSTVFTGAYSNGLAAVNSMTVFGGAGGGFYVGGLAGNNSLTGGTGAVTLVGAGTSDVLTAVSAQGNDIFSGKGVETLLGAAGSSNNLFAIGDVDAGIGNVTATGIASTEGSGSNTFFIFNATAETITGSTVTGASNTYFLINDSTAGGANFSITNFDASGNDKLELTNAVLGTSDATVVAAQNAGVGAGAGLNVFLSDGSQIFFKGLTSTVSGAGGGNVLGVSSSSGVITFT